MAVPNHNAPKGLEGYDIGALSQEQQEKLNQFKIQTRLSNEKYLREHPEVDCLLLGFLGDVLSKRPESIRDFAADWFTQPELPTRIQADLEKREKVLRDDKFQQKL